MTSDRQTFIGDEAHLAALLESARTNDPSRWNSWRQANNIERPDLRGADLSNVVLHDVNLQFANLSHAILENARLSATLDHARLDHARLSGARMWNCRLDETQLVHADCRRSQFRGSRIVASNFAHATLENADFERCYLEDTSFDDADLSGASFYQADLWMAFLRHATMTNVNLRGANLHGAKLTGATLTNCDLRRAVLVDSDIQGTTFSNCDIYGVSAWGLTRDEGTLQQNLRVSAKEDAPLYVDDLEVAQFVHLMVCNPRIRDVIDTISRKGVLILGRFTPERKAVLDGLRTRFRDLGYVPMIFDFEKPAQRDFEETVKILAGLSRFVVVDITNPSSSPLEIHATVPEYLIPFVPIIALGEKPFSMFDGLQQRFYWVLDTVEYPSEAALIRNLEDKVIRPALEMEARIMKGRTARPVTRLEE